MLIPYIKGIVIGKGGKYGVSDSIGKVIIPCEFDRIYSITDEGKEEFYLEQDGRVIKLDRYLEENKIKVEIPVPSAQTFEENTNQTENNVVNTNQIINNTVTNTNQTVNNTINTNQATNNQTEDNTVIVM